MPKLTWRERIVRTNRTAPTTRYFSLLRVSNKILSITLLRRKLHLQTVNRDPSWHFTRSAKKKSIEVTVEKQGNTLSCMDGVGHKSIVIHICLIVSPALSHTDTELLGQDLQICCLHEQHFLKDMMLLSLRSVDPNAYQRKCQL